MSNYEQCKIFKSWGQTNLDFFRLFVGPTFTPEQFKELTGADYEVTTTTV